MMNRSRATAAVLCAALFVATSSACGGNDDGSADSSDTAPSTTTTMAMDGGASTTSLPIEMSVILLAGVDRTDPPGGTDSSASTQVTVPKSAAKEWVPGAWGPRSKDQMPSIPTGFTPVLVWDEVPGTGWSLQFQSAKKVGKRLVINADRGKPGEGCDTQPQKVGTTYLLGVDVKGVTPSTPVQLKVRSNTISCVG